MESPSAVFCIFWSSQVAVFLFFSVTRCKRTEIDHQSGGNKIGNDSCGVWVAHSRFAICKNAPATETARCKASNLGTQHLGGFPSRTSIVFWHLLVIERWLASASRIKTRDCEHWHSVSGLLFDERAVLRRKVFSVSRMIVKIRLQSVCSLCIGKFTSARNFLLEMNCNHWGMRRDANN